MARLTPADPARVRRGYDRLAAIYEPLAAALSLGAIPRSRRRLLDRAAAGRGRALVVGGGPGDTLVALFETGFDGEVTCVDLSPAMLDRARRRLLRHRPDAAGRVRWVEASLDALPERPRFDLVCTHFVLDQFPADELRAVARRLAATIVPGGAWHEVDFAPPAAGVAGLAQRAIVRGLYGAFGAVCGLTPRALPPIDGAIRAAGACSLDAAPGACGLLRSALYGLGTGRVR